MQIFLTEKEVAKQIKVSLDSPPSGDGGCCSVARDSSKLARWFGIPLRTWSNGWRLYLLAALLLNGRKFL